MIRCNANLFRIATACQSKEGTRYYLCGVLIEPHHTKGVQLVATDGHRMLVIHDETGFADESAIVSLGADGLKHCKQKRGMRRDVVIETGAADATICDVLEHKGGALENTPVAVAFKVRIDGTFPAYRKVLPDTFPADGMPSFAGVYIASMGNIGVELAQHFTDWTPRDSGPSRKDGLIARGDASGPALVTWPSFDKAFGILMPIQHKSDANLPEWFPLPVVAAPDAAAELVPPCPVPLSA